MMNHDVSLLITAYNRPEALNLCLQSVLRQQISPTEVIVLDDGSTNEIKHIIQKYREHIPQLYHLWQRDEKNRLCRSRNIGIVFSGCEYLIYCDGDMVLPPNYIGDHIFHREPGYFVQGKRIHLSGAYTSRLLANGYVDSISPLVAFFNMEWPLTDMKTFHKRKYLLRSKRLSHFLSKRIKGARVKNIMGCNVACWKQDAISINGFNESHPVGTEDHEMFQRMMNAGVKEKVMRFMGAAYHLYHPYGTNWMLRENPDTDRVWCDAGVDKIYGMELDVGTLKKEYLRGAVDRIEIPG